MTRIIQALKRPKTEVLIRSKDDFLAYPIVNTNEIQLPVAAYKLDIKDGETLDISPFTLAPIGVIEIFNTMQSGALITTHASNPLIKTSSDLYIRNIALGSTGTSDCIQMTATTGFEALDMNTVTFTSGSTFGTLNGIRQVFWRNGFSFNPAKGFLLKGTMGGISIFDTRLINQFEYLLKADTGFNVNEIRSNVNANIPTGSILFDIDYVNINEDGGYGVKGARLEGTTSNGTGVAFKDFTTGDIGRAADSQLSFFADNTGALRQNTTIGGYWALTTATATTLTQNVPAKLNGTTTPSNMVWFSQTGNNEVTYNSSREIDVTVDFSGTIQGSNGNDIIIRLTRYTGGLGGTATVVDFVPSTINNSVGLVDVAYITLDSKPFVMNQGDVISVTVVNTSSGNDVTGRTDGRFHIKEA